MSNIKIVDEVEDYNFFEKSTFEDKYNDKLLTLEQAKILYNNLKSDDVNMVVKPNGAWMIECFHKLMTKVEYFMNEKDTVDEIKKDEYFSDEEGKKELEKLVSDDMD